MDVDQATAAWPAVTLRLYRPGDETGILALFQRVFARPRSLAHWRWKYLETPGGPPFLAVAESAEGEIVGHYGVLRAWGNVGGDRRQMVQVIDSMVSPDYRRQALKRPGLFVRLALFYFDCIEKEKLSTPELCWMGYGFPNASALRIGERLLGYTPLSPVGSWVVLAETLAQRLRPRGVEAEYDVREVKSVEASADRLWGRCAPELPTAIIRDQAYLNWRYRDCPDQTYRILLAENRFTGELEGLTVLRAGWQDRPVVAIVDWLVPARADGAARTLLRAALETAEAEQCPELAAWFPPHFSICTDLIALGFRSLPTDYWLVARSFWEPLSPEALGPTWYYTLGDSDLV